jgi:uncharacterized protein YkwD
VAATAFLRYAGELKFGIKSERDSTELELAMENRLHWRMLSCAWIAAALLAGCGGGGGGGTPVSQTGNPSSNPGTLTQEPGAPAMTGNTATDGANWINYRRAQIGLAALAHNSKLDVAAQGHSNYLLTNNTVTHTQTAGQPGFTGATPGDRIANAGYALVPPYAYGEVISATSNSSGFYQAEELITAIYHRFVIFEPLFRDIGTGSAAASGSNAYVYFTADMATSGGYGASVGPGNVVVYPFSGQTKVPVNFLSDTESPDPVPGQNEVGYPVSVHADLRSTLTVQSFTIKPHGGAALSTRLLSKAGDADTPASAAAIIPLAVLAGGTTYDVSFSGTVDGVAVNRSWSFSTK